jgi:hypothetical protein
MDIIKLGSADALIEFQRMIDAFGCDINLEEIGKSPEERLVERDNSIKTVLRAIELGQISLEQEKDEFVIVHNLFKPLNENRPTLKYRMLDVAKLKMSDQFNNNQGIGKQQAMIAAMAGEAIGMISRMLARDFMIAVKVSEVFFMVLAH